MRRLLLAVTILIALLAPAAAASAKASHAGWPHISGMLLMNKLDQARPLDGRPGHDPFDGTDPSYSCDGVHHYTGCIADRPGFAFLADRPRQCGHQVLHGDDRAACRVPATPTVPSGIHNELLGGHGNDTLYAGDDGDVLWGDYKPSGQPTSQLDHIHGGPGRDIIYASHGTNFIHTGGGPDIVHAHFGRGQIWCDSPGALVYISRRSRRGYHLHGCKRISHFTAGH
jgi:hypothetical protein